MLVIVFTHFDPIMRTFTSKAFPLNFKCFNDIPYLAQFRTQQIDNLL